MIVHCHIASYIENFKVTANGDEALLEKMMDTLCKDLFDGNRKCADWFWLVFIYCVRACAGGTKGRTSNDLCLLKNDTESHEIWAKNAERVEGGGGRETNVNRHNNSGKQSIKRKPSSLFIRQVVTLLSLRRIGFFFLSY